MARKGSGDVDTAASVLDVAERLVQIRGFNGFSYADIAAELQITKAALHYHFASKSELGAALIARYAIRFSEALVSIDERERGARAKLEAYMRLYDDVVRDERMCLCGMLAAEFRTLPGPMRDAVVGFFEDQEAWVRRVLEQGRTDGSLRFAGRPRDVAQMVVSGLEGAMLVARPYEDANRFRAAARLLIRSLVADDAPS